MSGDISVLVVDDDPDWGALVTHWLERDERGFDVSTARSAREALSVLETDPPECVVSDYEMPETSGLELLRKVRERRPDLPFLVVTARGSEDVAAEAIAAGVTDYVRKDSGADYAAILATRIRNAVEQWRATVERRATEARYEAVVENVRDAIYILTGGRIEFANPAATALTGYSEDELRDRDPIEFVHPEDVGPYRAAVAADDALTGYELRVVDRDGEVRECVLDRVPIAYDGTPAVMGVLKDITERKRRERALQRERDAKEAIREVLVRYSTREDLGAAFCRHLVENDGYAFAWIGTTGSGGPTPVATAGDADGYLSAAGVEAPIGGGGSDEVPIDDPEPGLAAFGADGIRVVRLDGDDGALRGDDEALRGDWRAAARERGFAAVASVPLRYRDVSHGVFAVYATEADAFTERRRRTLAELAETLGYALNAIETREALLTDETVRLRLRVADPDAGVVALASHLPPGSTFAVHAVVSRSEGTDLHLATVGGADREALAEVTSALPDRYGFEVLGEVDGGLRVRFALARPTLAGTVAEAGALFRGLSIESGVATVRAELPRRRSPREFVAAVGELFEGVTLDSQRRESPDETPPIGPLAALTRKQRDALAAAYFGGFFEQPKASSANDVAASLGVARSTFLQHLRAAERAVFGDLLADG